MAELMEGAVQQAPQPGRQAITICYENRSYLRLSSMGWRPI